MDSSGGVSVTEPADNKEFSKAEADADILARRDRFFLPLDEDFTEEDEEEEETEVTVAVEALVVRVVDKAMVVAEHDVLNGRDDSNFISAEIVGE